MRRRISGSRLHQCNTVTHQRNRNYDNDTSESNVVIRVLLDRTTERCFWYESAICLQQYANSINDNIHGCEHARNELPAREYQTDYASRNAFAVGDCYDRCLGALPRMRGEQRNVMYGS